MQSSKRTYEKSKISSWSTRSQVTGFVKKRLRGLRAKGRYLYSLWVPCNSICRESKTRLLISETGTRSFSSVNKPKARSLPAMARDAIKGYVCGETPLLPSITPPSYSIRFHPWPSYRLITIPFAKLVGANISSWDFLELLLFEWIWRKNWHIEITWYNFDRSSHLFVSNETNCSINRTIVLVKLFNQLLFALKMSEDWTMDWFCDGESSGKIISGRKLYSSYFWFLKREKVCIYKLKVPKTITPQSLFNFI